MRASFGRILVFLLILSSNAWAGTGAPKGPSTAIKPAEVVEIIIEALRTNDPSDGDEGIVTVWRFAAPSNRAFTGPLPRFKQMIKSGFPEMLNHIDEDFGPMEIRGDVALQPVWLVTRNGEQVGYLFSLRRQSEGYYEGMWMTESVAPIAPKKPSTTI